MGGRRSLAVGIVALLVVLAGCSAFGAGVPGTGDADTTTTEGVDSSVSPIYEPPLNTTDVAVDHVVALRKAGSFSYHSTVTISDANQSASVEFGRIANVDMDTGAMLVTRKDTSPGTDTIYVSPEGKTYVKSRSGSAELSYNVTNQSFDTSRYAINGVPRFLDMFELEYDGATTLNGEQVYRYSATSPEQVTSLSGVAGSDSGRELDSIEAYLYVAENGLIPKLTYTLSFETGQGAHTIKASTTYTKAGEVTVQEPDWTDDADAIMRGERNVTRTLTNESLDAELTLTADRTLFDRIRIIPGPGPLYSGDHLYEEAAVSSAVTPLFPPSASNVTLVLGYDESAVPEGGEGDLSVYRYAATQDSWEPINATQDTEANTFTVDFESSGAVVVMHDPSWDEATSDQN